MESIISKFYKYLNGEIELPFGHIIGLDCKYKHGLEGKTVRRLQKGTNSSTCIRCKQNSEVKAKHKKHEHRDLTALSKVEICVLEKDPFDI